MFQTTLMGPCRIFSLFSRMKLDLLAIIKRLKLVSQTSLDDSIEHLGPHTSRLTVLRCRCGM
jgi:hypothetical protein